MIIKTNAFRCLLIRLIFLIKQTFTLVTNWLQDTSNWSTEVNICLILSIQNNNLNYKIKRDIYIRRLKKYTRGSDGTVCNLWIKNAGKKNVIFIRSQKNCCVKTILNVLNFPLLYNE